MLPKLIAVTYGAQVIGLKPCVENKGDISRCFDWMQMVLRFFSLHFLSFFSSADLPSQYGVYGAQVPSSPVNVENFESIVGGMGQDWDSPIFSTPTPARTPTPLESEMPLPTVLGYGPTLIDKSCHLHLRPMAYETRE